MKKKQHKKNGVCISKRVGLNDLAKSPLLYSVFENVQKVKKKINFSGEINGILRTKLGNINFNSKNILKYFNGKHVKEFHYRKNLLATVFLRLDKISFNKENIGYLAFKNLLIKIILGKQSNGNFFVKTYYVDDSLTKIYQKYLEIEVENSDRILMKQKILKELNKPGFPDMKSIYSEEALDISLELLDELLDQEKKEFRDKLKIKDENITFDTFDDFSVVDYYFGLLYHLFMVKSSDKIRSIIDTFEEKYTDFGNEISYSKRYYDMLVCCREKVSNLENDQIRILDLSIKAYKIRGINLDEEKQEELKQINKQLSKLSLNFGKNVLESEKEFEYLVEDEKVLSDFPKADLEKVKQNAKKKGKKGYLFDSGPTGYSNIMKYCSDSNIRKDFYLARCSYASKGKYDNRKIVLDILNLRKKKASILGFNSYCDLSLTTKMAESEKQLKDLFTDLSNRSKKKALLEIKELEEYFGFSDLQPWDSGYYSRKLKQEKYSLDDRELKKYFEFGNIQKSLFDIAYRLFGVEMKKIEVSAYYDDVELYEVYRKGNLLAYMTFDYFDKKEKSSGAWFNVLRDKSSSSLTGRGLGGGIPIFSNVCDFQKVLDGKTLLTYSDAETMFHEFGHALHNILSTSKYSDLSGTHVQRDFVELPSQLMENWFRDRDCLLQIGKHFETGKSIPKNIVNTLEKLEKFGSGSFTLSQCQFALLDIILHGNIDIKSVKELDKVVLQIVNENSIYKKGDEYKMYCSFSHIFDGGYSSGYYGYMWAEIIEKDIWNEFKKNGIFDKKTREKYLNTIMSKGHTKDADKLFLEFMGREIKLDAFFEFKGF